MSPRARNSPSQLRSPEVGECCSIVLGLASPSTFSAFILEFVILQHAHTSLQVNRPVFQASATVVCLQNRLPCGQVFKIDEACEFPTKGLTQIATFNAAQLCAGEIASVGSSWGFGFGIASLNELGEGEGGRQ